MEDTKKKGPNQTLRYEAFHLDMGWKMHWIGITN